MDIISCIFSPMKVGGVDAYIYIILKFTENESLRLNVYVCKDL